MTTPEAPETVSVCAVPDDPDTAKTVLVPTPLPGKETTALPPPAEQETSVGRVPRLSSEPLQGSLGPYALDRELARGGMGVVYLARHRELGREVALKVLRAGADANPDQDDRFLREARAAARLDHPHVVKIHDVGQVRGQRYLAMDLVRGESLQERIDRGALDGREAARLLLPLAEALQEAHTRSILHRDLKPANVLLDEHGRALLTDFGLAKDLSSADPALTESGMVVGTPAYMPPEQAKGYTHLVGPQSDVYALGATLFQAITGQAPFQGESVMQVLQAVLKKEPPRPRKLRPGLDVDLETICLTCLEKDPARRYPTAQALADDLRAYLELRPISAKPPSLLSKLRKWRQRNAAVARVASLVGGAAVLLLAAATVAFVLRLAHERALASDARDRALESEAEAREAQALATERAEQLAAAVIEATDAQKLASYEAKRAREALERANQQADLSRRALDVLLFDARQQARAGEGEMLELLEGLEPPRDVGADLAHTRASFAKGLAKIAEVRRRQGQLGGAELALEQALELIPETAAERIGVLAALGEVRAERDNAAGALAVLEEAEGLLGEAEDVRIQALRERLAPNLKQARAERNKAKLQSELLDVLSKESQDEKVEALARFLLKRARSEPKTKRASSDPETTTTQAASAARAALDAGLERLAAESDGTAREALAWRLQRLQAEGRLGELASVRHFLRQERDNGGRDMALRVEIRVEGREVVLEVLAERLTGGKRIRTLHRLGLDGRLVRTRLFTTKREYVATPDGARLAVVRVDKGKPRDCPPWDPDRTLFLSVGLFLLPPVADLTEPYPPVRAPFVLDLFGLDDYTGAPYVLRDGGWHYDDEARTRRTVEDGLERIWVKRKQVTYQQVSEARIAKLRADAPPAVPRDDAELEAAALEPDAQARLVLAWAYRLERRASDPERADESAALRAAALSMFELAALKGSGAACAKLGYEQQDLRWLQLGAALGNVECLLALAQRVDPANHYGRQNGSHDAEAAEAIYRQALALRAPGVRDDLARLLLWRAQQASQTQAWDEAEAHLAELRALEARNGPEAKKVARVEAQLLRGRGEPLQAAERLTEAIRAEVAGQERMRARFSRAIKLSEAMRDEVAGKQGTPPVKTEWAPTEPLELVTDRAACYLEAKDYERSLADYTQVAERNPRDADSALTRVRLLLHLKRHQEGFDALVDALKRNPQHLPSWEFYIEMCRANGLTDQALQGLDKLAKVVSNPEDLTFSRALILAEGGRFGEASPLFAAAKQERVRDYAQILAAATGEAPEGLSELAARDDWLGTLAGLVSGELSVEHALELAEQAKAKPAERAGRRCEVRGYAGMVAERDGDLEQARAHYEACVATGLRGYAEFLLAERRLAAFAKAK